MFLMSKDPFFPTLPRGPPLVNTNFQISSCLIGPPKYELVSSLYMLEAQDVELSNQTKQKDLSY